MLESPTIKASREHRDAQQLEYSRLVGIVNRRFPNDAIYRAALECVESNDGWYTESDTREDILGIIFDRCLIEKPSYHPLEFYMMDEDEVIMNVINFFDDECNYDFLNMKHKRGGTNA
jgi:hypothetical protein